MTLSLDEILADASKYACEQLRKDGEMRLAVVIGYRRGTDATIYHAIEMDPAGKTLLAMRVALSLRGNDCDRYVFISEVWISEIAAQLGIEPKDASDMRDGLTIAACDAVSAVENSFIVEKDWKGRVTLTPYRQADTRRPGVAISGRWYTMLAPGFDPTGVSGPRFETKGGTA